MLNNTKYKFLRSLLDSKTIGVPVVIQTDLLDSKTVKLPVITQSDSKTIKPSVIEQSDQTFRKPRKTLVNHEREESDIKNVRVPAITQTDAYVSKTTGIPVVIQRGDSKSKTTKAPILNKKHDFDTDTTAITLENVSYSRSTVDTVTNQKDVSASNSVKEFDTNQTGEYSSRNRSDVKSDSKEIDEPARNQRQEFDIKSSEPVIGQRDRSDIRSSELFRNQKGGSDIMSSESFKNQREGFDIKSSEPVRNQGKGSDIGSSAVRRVKQRSASENSNIPVYLMNQTDSKENKTSYVGVINQRGESSSWTIRESLTHQNESSTKEHEERDNKTIAMPDINQKDSSYNKTTDVPIYYGDRPGSKTMGVILDNQNEKVTRTNAVLEEEYTPTLRISKPAPEFAGTALVSGEFMKISLTDFMGKYLVFFFYPMDLSCVCPTEIIAFSDRVDEFRALNCEVVTCSKNSGFSHLAWINTPIRPTVLDRIKVPILFDPTKVIHKSYNVLGDEGIAIRGLFIIDDKGCVRQININGMPVGINIDGILRLVKAFQFVDKHGEVGPTGWEAESETNKKDQKNRKVYFAK